MNKIIRLATFILLSASLCAFSQRPLPGVQDKKELESDDDVVGKWKWFCGSVVTVSPDGNVSAIWDDGKQATARYEKIEDNRYRFIWGNNEWIDILKLKKNGNILDGQNQCGSKVTAIKISDGTNTSENPNSNNNGFQESAKRTMHFNQNPDNYVGEWKMSSWDGRYQLFKDGSCTINNNSPDPARGLWFIAFDRLYLVWEGIADADVFKLNPDQSLTLQRIDTRPPAGVSFSKVVRKE
jgi:hypothetical protein